MSFVKDIARVAIAVRDLDRAREFFEKAFDAEFEDTEDVKDMKFRYTPFTVGGKKLELLSPYDDDSPIARFLKKRGEGIHHISFEVDDLDQAIDVLRHSQSDRHMKNLFSQLNCAFHFCAASGDNHTGSD